MLSVTDGCQRSSGDSVRMEPRRPHPLYRFAHSSKIHKLGCCQIEVRQHEPASPLSVRGRSNAITVTLHFIGTSSIDDRGQLINRNDIAMLSAPAEAAPLPRCVQLPLGVVLDCAPPRPRLMASDAPAVPPGPKSP
jgi:hypothetical protein